MHSVFTPATPSALAADAAAPGNPAASAVVPPAALTVVGALHLDLVARLAGPHRAAASNPVRFTAAAGGVAANVARAIAAAGLPCRLVCPAGEGEVDPSLHLPGVSITRVTVAGHTAGRYVAILDETGELVAGYSDTLACEHVPVARLLGSLPATDPAALILETNLSAEALEGLVSGLVSGSRAPVVALAVSPHKARRLLPLAERIALLFCNRREAASLTDEDADATLDTLADALQRTGFSRTVLTDGPAGILVAEPDRRCRLAALEPGPNGAGGVNGGVNGAGDALAGATLAALALAPASPSVTPATATPGGSLHAALGLIDPASSAPNRRTALAEAVAGAGRQAALDVLQAR